MLSLVQLHSAALDSPLPGISLIHGVLFLLMILAIPMIPYVFLYLFVRDQSGEGESAQRPIRKLTEWLHVHRPLELLHHH